MEAWFMIVVFLSLCLLIRAFFNLLFPSCSRPLLPGPPYIPIIGTFLLLRKYVSQLRPILQDLHAQYGPIVTVATGSQPAIFISDRSLAHQALVQNGAILSNSPKALATTKIINSNQHNINSAFYGPTWRLLRRNLISEMLHPNRSKSFFGTRRRVLNVLLNRLKSGSPIRVIDHLHHAMFCLLVSMCFGEGLDEKKIKDIENVQRRLLVNLRKFNFLNIWRRVTRILFRKRWEELFQIRKEQEDVLLPLIRLRIKAKEQRKKNNNRDKVVVPYVDTLLDLVLPEEKRKLHESELVALCSEFLNGGTDTTATALQWILANLVKYLHNQQRVVEEIREAIGEREHKEVKEEDLNRLPYLKAVILEGLRRHPPGHFVLPHAVSGLQRWGGIQRYGKIQWNSS